MPVLEFYKAIGKPNMGQLRPKQAKIHRRVPKMARVRAVFGYDGDYERVYYLETGEMVDGEAEYITMDGLIYAAWRVKSILLLGTTNGRSKTTNMLGYADLMKRIPRKRRVRRESESEFRERALSNIRRRYLGTDKLKKESPRDDGGLSE